MNLRDIKKDIEYVIGAFVDDCTLFLNMNPGKNAGEITDLIDEAPAQRRRQEGHRKCVGSSPLYFSPACL